MFTKYFAVTVVLAFCLFQNVSAMAKRNALQNERSLKDIIEKAENAIAHLRDLVHNVVESAKNKLQSMEEAIVAKGQEIIEDTNKKIAEEIERVKTRVEKIKEQAQHIGVNIKECLEKYEDALKEIPIVTMKKLISCVTDLVKRVVETVKQGVDLVIDIRNKVASFPTDLKNCRSASNPIKCAANLVTTVVGAIESAPSEITRIVHSVVEIFTHAKADLEACAVEKLIEAAKLAASVGSQVAVCSVTKTEQFFSAVYGIDA